ncbi:MAG: hypothetical protein CVV27_03450 [Candidatus Melainabacteria bacterium HGW-Melainabacteria-1]|nr:MAG: hypothetical protein CVV27_03450 [Candidatus Melainabacteria bacterium HGW-Melainabacteria-1]
MTLVVIETGDGSTTFFDTAKNIHYRSLQGARGEADYVFVTASKIASRSAPWRVLELGLGTGMNFLATAEALLEKSASMPAEISPRLEYTAVERAPLRPDLYRQLGHAQRLKAPWLAELLESALEQLQHQSMTQLNVGPVSLTVYASDWQRLSLPEHLQVDAIYHDPFGPKQNPEAWTAECFGWSSRHLSEAGRLVTYAAATGVRRAMVAAGLSIASLPGTGSKREMTVAAKSAAVLSDATLLTAARFRP